MDYKKILVNLINLSTFSGFMFCFGYTNQIAYYRKEWKNSFGKMLKNVCRMLIAFYISGIAYVALVEGKIFRWKFVAEVVMLKKYPGWSEFLVSFAAVLLVGIFLYPIIRRMNTIMFLGVACISCIACYIPYERIHNFWLALLTGSRDYITFPVLQYGVFLRLEFWFAKGDQMESPDTAADNNCRNPMPDYCFENRFFAGTFSAFRMVYLWGFVLVYGYYLIAVGMERKRNLYIIEKIAHYFEEIGKTSLYYLLMSNLLIFALASSSFSFRSEMYAYTFFGMLLLIMWYLNHINNAKNGGKQK